ncbi:MAG TPA: hypothetical protein VI299_15750, partial [Polyangiales bacterium]
RARDALLHDVLAQAYPAPAHPAPARKSWLWMAAAILMVCVGTGSASAAVLWYVRSHVESKPPHAAEMTRPKVVARHAEPALERARDAVVAPQPTATAAPAKPRPATRAEDWFREGNRLRAARRWKQADEAYGLAAQHATHEDSAYVAYVASAGVRLEHLGDARGALQRYRAALRASARGALDEEIRMGMADAFRALGDRAREREALEILLRDHPASALAEQARNRLR